MKKLIVTVAAVGLVLSLAGLVTSQGQHQSAPSSTTTEPEVLFESPTTTTDATSSTSTTTSTTMAATSLDPNTDALERTQPLVHVLPHSTSHYTIDYRVLPDGNRLALTITLDAVLNRADELASYQAQLRSFKAQALDYLRSQDADPTAYPITYDPAEAANL